MQAYDLMDFPLLRDVLFDLVVTKESFYVREMRRAKKLSYVFVDPTEPAKMDPETNNKFVGGKRYLVRLQNTFDIEQIEIDGEGELVFETTELPFAESVGTTKIIDERGTLSDDEIWGFGMGLIDDPDSRKYTHTGTSFRIYNAGNVPIHPFEQGLKITLTGIKADNFTLTNRTNGSQFKINEAVNNQTIRLDGPNITSNGLAFLRATNKQFITLEPGWNEFTASSNVTAQFEFRFYYK